ncbi:CBL-interacting serine/threonine-protein kinase 12-like [Hibiscus syriacus]|uniref:CBL-interacting serine/threonine-protein kinase 12-like n=1 Tax=Hibiscus syriacus TaxID=106335 RepID=A0A6A3BFZ7_HIBSY|nr:CBL-interacting serine/threonine-protein kinase 12-like [Hibiscus syriacus]
MKNTIRCCISCILPCGALDVIRIVHINGRVEEISGTIKAGDIMRAYPKHVLKKPSSSAADEGMVPKIIVVPPEADLQRGKIYFLIPLPSTPEKSRSKSTKKKKKDNLASNNNDNGTGATLTRTTNNTISTTNLLVSDQYLSEILSEKLSTQRDRRRGRVGVWRPHLESISESPNDG